MENAGYTLVPPRWIIEPTDKAFAQGSDAKVECKADGFPRPVVTWKRASGDSPGDYKDLKPDNPDVKYEDGTLFIHNIQKGNEGYYLCEAVNGIGSGLSAVIMISVQAPPQFDLKMRNQTARINEPTVLQCEAKGEKPIGILWNMNNKRLDPKSDIRYTIREEILPHGVLSDLSIRNTGRDDSALFTCVATNSFGSDDTSINLIVQEVPEKPHALKVLDKSGRTVQLSWTTPYDGNSPIKRYLIEFKVSKGSWDVDIDRVMVPGQQNMYEVPNLSPATTYHMRVVAENEVGTSEPSEPVTIITAEESPSGLPTNVKVEAVDQETLKVTWKPPERDDWNGEIQGYYVGYKLTNSDKPYLFETVEFSKEEGKEHHLLISSLKTYTQYSVVVQAFNKLGAGPTSDEMKQYTAEGTPEESPKEPACTTLTSQTIRVSWSSPNPTTANGVIKGYKVIYGPSETWYDEKSKDSKITSASETIIHGLKKYTNYSMQVLAFTAGGDGVRSAPIHCQTEQDVPDSPTAIKALAKSEESILISWKPPSQPNGVIAQYTVYIKEESKSGKFMDHITVSVDELSEMTFEQLLTRFDVTHDQAYDSEIGGDSDADDGFPHRAPSSSKKRAKRRRLAEADEVSAGSGDSSLEPSGSGSSSDSGASGEESNIDQVDLEEIYDEPTINPRIPISNVDSEEEEEEIYNLCDPDTLIPKWKKGTMGTKISENFKSSKFEVPFGPKVLIDVTNFLTIFSLFFNENLLNLIVQQSNLYATQRGHILDLHKDELSAFLGMLIIMGFHKLPTMRLYWSIDANFSVNRISNIMPLRRFLKIMRFLHLNDNTKMPQRDSKNFDKLFKIKPYLDHFQEVLQKLFSPSRFLAVDESMIAFKGRSSMKQYMPMKPIKRGFKVWAICCSVTGFMLAFDFYSGKDKERTPGNSVGESVVLNLSKSFQHLGYCIFFDRFFTSFSLIKKLLMRGIFSCGTILQTKKYFPKNTLKTDKDLKYGESDACYTTDFGVVKWKDRGVKSVTVASSMDDPNESIQINRKNKTGEKVVVNCPTPITTYNKYMGGVDMFDQYMSYYSTQWKSRRWWLKVFYYFLDVAIVNSFILYKEESKKQRKKYVSQLLYRSELADNLIKDFSTRKSGLPQKLEATRKKFSARPSTSNIVPPQGHLPEYGKQRRCALCSTKKEPKKTVYKCDTCDVGLCIIPCFKQYHINMTV